MEEEIIQRYHADIWEGHPGEARTVEKITWSFYFPGITRKVRKFIRACDDCQRNKPTHTKPQGFMQTIVLPTQPWKQITADFVDMPKVKNAHGKDTTDRILVVVDRFSKQTILIPVRKNFTTAEIFQNEYLRYSEYQTRLSQTEIRYSDPKNGGDYRKDSESYRYSAPLITNKRTDNPKERYKKHNRIWGTTWIMTKATGSYCYYCFDWYSTVLIILIAAKPSNNTVETRHGWITRRMYDEKYGRWLRMKKRADWDRCWGKARWMVCCH